MLHSKTMTQVLLLLLGGMMDVDITQNANHAECIRCGRCIKACPAEAICYRYGFGNEKTKENS